MAEEYILKTDLLKMLALKKSKWCDMKGQHQDVTHENFIDDIILAFDWIINDVENFPSDVVRCV